MDTERLDVGININHQQQPDKNTDLKTSDVYKVHKNLPKRFNNPGSLKGYSTKMVHPLYQTTNQTYGSKKPTVHEMPTAFHGSWHKFSDHMLKIGMSRDKVLNTSLDKSHVTGPNTTSPLQDRIIFQHFYNTGGNNKAEASMI